MIKWIFAICMAIMVAGCSELDVSGQTVVDDEKETPPTVYVSAGFYVWDGGEVSLYSNLTFLVRGIYPDSSGVFTHYLDVTYATADNSDDLTTTSAFPIQLYYTRPVTYSHFVGQNLAATVDQIWVYAPKDITAPYDAVQVFVSFNFDVTFPADNTVPSQTMLLLSNRGVSSAIFADNVDYPFYFFALSEQTQLAPPPFGLVGTEPTQNSRTYIPSSICPPPSSGGTPYVYSKSESLFIEIVESRVWGGCGGDTYAQVDILIRGKLRPAALPPNLSMVCTPGKGCEFTP